MTQRPNGEKALRSPLFKKSKDVYHRSKRTLNLRHYSKEFVRMALSENLSIGQIAPDFSGKSLQGEVDFHEWLNNSWGVLMFYPGAFTPICTTEMCSLTKKHKVCHFTEH